MSAGTDLARRLGTSVSGWYERRRRVEIEAASFVLVAGVYLLHLATSGYTTFYYDADEYWRLGDQFVHNGHFSLLSYAYDWRGYSMPLLTHVLDVVGSAFGMGVLTIVRVFGACLAATLGVIVAPRLARALFPTASIGPARVLALNGLLFIYWRDHFGFPLVDFPSLLAACVGVLALLRASTAGYLVAGIALGLAANLRPNYGFAALAAIAVAALIPLRPWDWRRRSAAAALLTAGVFLALLPQIAINHHQRGNWSPFIAKAHTQTLISIWVGMTAQKYETYVGPASEYPEPGVSYLDPATTHLLELEGITPVVAPSGHLMFPSTGKYLHVVVHHPVEMTASYVRHVFNGLDVRYPTPYIRDLGDTTVVLSLLEYTLLFLAFARLLLPEAHRALGGVRWAGLLVLVSACIGVLQVHAEPRYFLPLQLPIYLLVCFGPSTRTTIFGGSSGRRIGLAVAYVAFVLVCLTLSSETQAQLEHSG